jgi:hypothetical protein
MEIRTERQLNVVADEVSAITAVAAPILVTVETTSVIAPQPTE